MHKRERRVMPSLWLAGAALAAIIASTADVQAQGPPRTLAYAHDDFDGFTPIFDGATLDGWDGDPGYWRVEEGTLVGQSTAEAPLEQNTFLIWRGGADDGVLRDFELKLEFRMVGGRENSGVQVRSDVAPDAAHPWRLIGYQPDMDFNNNYTGMVYGEGGTGDFLAPRGQVTQTISGRDRPQQIASLGNDLELRGLQHNNAWNTYHIIFRGNTLISIVNGRVTSILIDDDLAVGGGPRLEQGLIGLQLHSGPPMRVEFREIYLKDYGASPDP